MPWRMSSWAAVLAVLSASWTGLAQGMIHQEGSNTSTETCSIPASLSSFQGTYHCNSSVKVIQSGSKEEVAGILQQYTIVNKDGSSHSWSQEQVNMGDNPSVVTEINTTLALQNSMPASSGSHGASISPMEAFLLGAACALTAGALLMLAATWYSMPIPTIQVFSGVYLGIIVIGVLAACAKWGSPRLLAYMASCAWFVSPALAFGVMLLVAIPSMKNDEKHKALHLAIRLLPWLVSGAMAVILAQVMKADFAKEWAAWLQAIIIVGVSFGGPLNIALCLEKLQKDNQTVASGQTATKNPQGHDGPFDGADSCSVHKRFASKGLSLMPRKRSQKGAFRGAAAKKPKGHVADKQDHVSSTKKQLPATSEEQKAVWWNICKYLTQQQCARAAGTCKASWAVQQQRIRILPKEYTDSQRFEEELQKGFQKKASGGAAAQESSQGHGFSTESADQQKSASPTEKQLTPVHSCFGHLSSGAVYSLRTPRMLLEDWKTECRKDGYYTTATHRIGGNYSYVMMTKKDMPNIQQIYLVDDEFPSERISRYWEQGFFITSMATLPTQWAVVMSTDSGFEEQYVRVHHVVGTTHPSKCGTAIGRRGHFDCKEDPSDFQVTACAATKLRTVTVMSKPVDKACRSLDKSASPQPQPQPQPQVQVQKQTSRDLLLKDWMAERRKEGFAMTSAGGQHGDYSLVMMSKTSAPYTQLVCMVEDEVPSLRLWDYWKRGFYITSLAAFGSTQWAVVMSTGSGCMDQYVRVVGMRYPYSSNASGRNGEFRGDPGKFQVTACASNKSQLMAVMSKPVDKGQTGLDKLRSPLHWPKVHEQTSQDLLLTEWMAERRKDGFRVTSTASHHGNYSLVMMAKQGTPYTQLACMVEDEFPSRQLHNLWESGFSITSLAAFGSTQWAVVMSTGSGCMDQYVRVVGMRYPYDSHASGRNGEFRGDPGEFQVTAWASNKSQLVAVMSKPVDKARKGLDITGPMSSSDTSCSASP